MIRKVDVGNVFGTGQRTSYEYMKLLNKKTNGNFKTLVVDDKDGLHSLPFANHGSKVVVYEPNEIYINGGIIDDITITPITNRKYFKENESKIKIRNTNFYESKVEDKYDFVYCYRSLHENHNKKIPMKRKIRKLLSSVKDDENKYVIVNVINKYIYNNVEELWSHKELLNNTLNYTKEEFMNAFYNIFGKEKVINSKIVEIEFKVKNIH